MAKIKKLFAIHIDAYGKAYRTKIAEGTTADFAKAKGFVIHDFENHYEEIGDGRVKAGSKDLGLNGLYPMIHSDEFSKLEGRLLTLCDATFTNKEQKTAFKSMVSQTLWNFYDGEMSSTNGHYQISDTLSKK